MPSLQQRRIVLGERPLTGAERAVRYGLVSAWNLNEASGNRADSFGTNTLTDINTVTSGAALVGALAAQFTSANSERLTSADNASLSPGDTPYWMGAWVNHDTLPGSGLLMGILDKLISGGGARSYRLYTNNTGGTIRFGFRVRGSNDSTDTTVLATTFGTPSTGIWYFVFGWHDPDRDLIGITVNAGAINTAAHAAGTLDTATAFNIGAVEGTGSQYMNGRIDAAAFGNNVPGGFGIAPASEITAYLFNGGAGREWPWA